MLLIVAVGGWLRFHRIDATSFWTDELLSVHVSNGHAFAVDRLPRNELIHDVPDLMSLPGAKSVWPLWKGVQGDIHPPLYYVSLRLWRELFGDSPTAIRSLSAACGTLALLAVFLAGRELAGSTAALWAAAINALAANHIFYSQEARMYALEVLLTTLVLAIVLRIGRKGFTYPLGVALALCCLAAMLTVYVSASVLLAAAAYAAIRLRCRDRRMTFASFVLAGMLFAIAWLPALLRQGIGGVQADWLKGDPNGHLWTTLSTGLRLPMDHLGVALPSGTTYAYGFAVVYVLPLLFVRRRPALLLPWLSMVLIVALPFAADLWRTTVMLSCVRYTVTLIPAMSLAIVGIAVELKPRIRWIVPMAILLYSALSLSPLYAVKRFDFRALALAAEQASLRGDGRLVVLSTANGRFNNVLLLAMQFYWQRPPQQVVMVESIDALNELPATVTGDRIILVAGQVRPDWDQLARFRMAPRRPQTWSEGAGTVNALERVIAPEASATGSSPP